jgi:hypothetical protein
MRLAVPWTERIGFDMAKRLAEAGDHALVQDKKDHALAVFMGANREPSLIPTTLN